MISQLTKRQQEMIYLRFYQGQDNALTGTATLKASFDFDEAYSGGTSAPAADSKFDLIYKQAAARASNLRPALYFSDDLANPVFLDVNDDAGTEWNTQTLDLSAYADR